MSNPDQAPEVRIQDDDTFPADFLHGMIRAAELIQPNFGTVDVDTQPIQHWQTTIGREGEHIRIGFEAWCQRFDNDSDLVRSFRLTEQVQWPIPSEAVGPYLGRIGRAGYGNYKRRNAYYAASAFARSVTRLFSIEDADPSWEYNHFAQVSDNNGFVYRKTDLWSPSSQPMSPLEVCIVSPEEEAAFGDLAYAHMLDRINGLLGVLGLPGCDFRDGVK